MPKFQKFIPSASSGATKDGESNDCVVRAITNCTGKPYDEIHKLLKDNGRQDRKATKWTSSIAALKSLGYDCVLFGNCQAAKWYAATQGKKREKGISLGRLVKELPKGKFVVFVKGHATALIDGEIVDTFDNSAHKPVVAVYYSKDFLNK